MPGSVPALGTRRGCSAFILCQQVGVSLTNICGSEWQRPPRPVLAGEALPQILSLLGAGEWSVDLRI